MGPFEDYGKLTLLNLVFKIVTIETMFPHKPTMTIMGRTTKYSLPASSFSEPAVTFANSAVVEIIAVDEFDSIDQNGIKWKDLKEEKLKRRW